MKTPGCPRLAGWLLACLLLALRAHPSCATGAEATAEEVGPAKIEPIVRTVDLNRGESADVELADGSRVRVELLALEEVRDSLRNAVRAARVKIRVAETLLTLTSATYSGRFLVRVQRANDRGETATAQLAVDVAEPFAAQTRVAIRDGRWQLNERVTYPGTRCEGLLMNVRMVNSVFEDRLKPEFDAGANTDRFLAQIPDYAAHGVRAFTIGLQGGMPGYEGARNSAFDPDGTLRPAYLQRVSRVIEACDRQGLVVILGCFYQRQDQVLIDADAVRRGVVNVVRWLQHRGYRNVVLEIANEFDHRGFDHPLLRSVDGQIELIRLAKQTGPGLLVSTSGLGHGRYPDQLAETADFLLIHFNSTPVDQIPARIAALKEFRKPIVCNEDDKLGENAVRAAEASVTHGASWGLMLKEINQYFPLEFGGVADAPDVYGKLRALTSAK